MSGNDKGVYTKAECMHVVKKTGSGIADYTCPVV